MAEATADTRELITRVTEKGEGLLEAVESFAADFSAALRAFEADVDSPRVSDAAYQAAVRSSGLRDLIDLSIEMHAILEEAMSQRT